MELLLQTSGASANTHSIHSYSRTILMRIAASLCCLVLIVGCGGNSYEIAPASGTVTMDGEPLANVNVNFRPTGGNNPANPGPSSYAKTDEQGNFTLLITTDDSGGAVVGTHQVSLTTPDTNESEDADISDFVDPVPARYNAQSQLTTEVPSGGTDAIKLELTSERDELDEVDTSY